GEEKALFFLKQKNYSIIKRNWRCRAGEIDIIAREGDTLCFIEVKSRNTNSHGTALESVDRFKKEKLITLAEHYISENNISDTDLRFDVVAVFRDSVKLLRNAFKA
ncbi:MAG: YraN family protein, partial [Elusimicrobiota bacterium]